MGNIVQTERVVGGKAAGGDPGDDFLSKTELDMICNLLNVDERVIPKLPRGRGVTYQLVLVTEEGIPTKGPAAKKKPAKKSRKKR